MRLLALALAALALAGCPPAATVAPPSPPPAVAAPACDGRELQVGLPPVTPGGGTATLEVRRSGDGLAREERATCVRRGEHGERVAPGATRVVTFGADPRRLQRLVIGGQTLLVHVPPGARLRLHDNPCYTWELDNSAQRTPWSAAPPYAYCAAPSDSGCRPGFRRAAPPRPAEDPLCPYGERDVVRRCVAAGVVRLAPTAGAPGASAAEGTPAARSTPPVDETDPVPLAALAGGRRLELYPRDCGFPRVAAEREVVGLAIGVGDRWLLRVDAAGHLQGEAE